MQPGDRAPTKRFIFTTAQRVQGEGEAAACSKACSKEARGPGF